MDANATPARYIGSRDKQSRLGALRALTGGGAHMPTPLVEDLLALDLAPDERLALLEAAGSTDKKVLEHFLTAHFFAPNQDLAALAVRLWSQKTDHLLWFRVLAAARAPLVPQRVLFTALDHAADAGGRLMVDECAARDGLEDLSPAFWSLLLVRALQWNVEGPRLAKLAETCLKDMAAPYAPDNKAVSAALAYVARYHPEELERLLAARVVAEPWRDIIRVLAHYHESADKQLEKLQKLAQKPPKGAKAAAKWLRELPPLWLRHRLEAPVVAAALAAVAAAENEPALDPSGRLAFEPFGGVLEATLGAALTQLEDEAVFGAALGRVQGLFTVPSAPALLDQLKDRLRGSADPAKLLGLLPLRLRLALTGDVPALKAEECDILAHKTPAAPARFVETATDGPDFAARRAYFDTVHRGMPPPAGKPEGFWGLLRDAWSAPTEPKLQALAQAARQVDGVFRLAYINTLGRFKGTDQAALKTLDFIRTKEEDELRCVVYALDGIGTQRATQELVSTLTRPNAPPALQLEICAILKRHDVTNLQNELRSALSDLGSRREQNAETREVRELVSGLLTTAASDHVPAPPKAGAAAPLTGTTDLELDKALAGRIPHYRELSSEVKRALRTSQYFHIQVSHTNAPESIDLSPVIDMQYKALELLFREMFEDACSRLIHKGVLQRRLDVIGYARPVPRAMDEFEAYVEKLPVIREIPFFSKFKLRKLLRAICQFRPGKRFTLDGLKAFALFFLCFGRSECRYGLGGLFDLGFPDDATLFSFCKELHVLQDFRNRAAHEGFHPDASSDIDSIWRSTAEIVQVSYKIKGFLEQAVAAEFAPKNRSAPVIEKKVS